MELSQLASEVSNLKEMVNLIDNTVKFHLQMQWAVLAFIVAASGAALYVMARYWVAQAMETKVKEIKDAIIAELEAKHIKKHIEGLWNAGGIINNRSTRRINIGFKLSLAKIVFQAYPDNMSFIIIDTNGSQLAFPNSETGYFTFSPERPFRLAKINPDINIYLEKIEIEKTDLVLSLSYSNTISVDNWFISYYVEAES